MQVFERVPVQPRDAREASDVFYKQGLGDVLLNYENEVVLTNETFGDKALPYIVPDNNVNVRPLSCRAHAAPGHCRSCCAVHSQGDKLASCLPLASAWCMMPCLPPETGWQPAAWQPSLHPCCCT